jgi:hypothetical protein
MHLLIFSKFLYIIFVFSKFPAVQKQWGKVQKSVGNKKDRSRVQKKVMVWSGSRIDLRPIVDSMLKRLLMRNFC